jgi:hypothetical protein
LLLELSDRELKGDIYKSMEEILSKYGEFAAFEYKLTIVTNDKLENLISSIQKFVIDKKLIQRMYDQASSFTDKAEKTAGEEKKK